MKSDETRQKAMVAENNFLFVPASMGGPAAEAQITSDRLNADT